MKKFIAAVFSILGAIAVIITIFSFVTGEVSLPQLVSRNASGASAKGASTGRSTPTSTLAPQSLTGTWDVAETINLCTPSCSKVSSYTMTIRQTNNHLTAQVTISRIGSFTLVGSISGQKFSLKGSYLASGLTCSETYLGSILGPNRIGGTNIVACSVGVGAISNSADWTAVLTAA